jgi:hypothetical protein
VITSHNILDLALSSHVINKCYHPVLSPNDIIPCYHHFWERSVTRVGGYRRLKVIVSSNLKHRIMMSKMFWIMCSYLLYIWEKDLCDLCKGQRVPKQPIQCVGINKKYTQEMMYRWVYKWCVAVLSSSIKNHLKYCLSDILHWILYTKYSNKEVIYTVHSAKVKCLSYPFWGYTVYCKIIFITVENMIN